MLALKLLLVLCIFSLKELKCINLYRARYPLS